MRVFLTDLSHLDKAELARLHESLPTFRKASAAQCKGENYPQHVVSFCLVRYAACQIAPSVDTESWCLAESGKPHLIRTPLVPNITDTEENLKAIAAIIGESPWEKLPYNQMAGAKYEMLNMKFEL
jgi:hypothetical protein